MHARRRRKREQRDSRLDSMLAGLPIVVGDGAIQEASTGLDWDTIPDALDPVSAGLPLLHAYHRSVDERSSVTLHFDRHEAGDCSSEASSAGEPHMARATHCPARSPQPVKTALNAVVTFNHPIRV